MTLPIGALTVRLPANKALTIGELEAIAVLLRTKTKEVLAQGMMTSRIYEEITALYSLECAVDDWLNEPNQEAPLTLAKLTSPDWVKDYFDKSIAPHLELTQLPTERLKI